MSGLGRIQHDFQEYLLHATAGRGGSRGRHRSCAAAHAPAHLQRCVLLAAHRSARSELPALAELLGEKDFARLAAEYIATHDSRFASIRYYGDELAQFLATEPRYRPVPLLADLARWEWTMAAVFDAADADPIDARAVQSKSPAEWATMRLTFHPSVHVLEFAWNAPQIWKAMIDNAPRPPAAVSREPVLVAPVAPPDEGILPLSRRPRGGRPGHRALRRNVRRRLRRALRPLP